MKSYLVIGLGRFGCRMAEKLLEQNHYVLAVESDEERAVAASQLIPNIQTGDATQEQYIKSLKVSQFDVCIVSIGDNFQNSLEITALLKENGAKFIVARASRDVQVKSLKMAGADDIIYTEKEMAERLAVKYGSEKIEDYIKLSDNYSIYEITLPKSWKGKTLSQLAVRQKYNINLLAVKKDKNMFTMPDSAYVFDSCDTVVVLAENNDLKKFIKLDLD